VTSEEYLESKHNLERDVILGTAYTKLANSKEFKEVFNKYLFTELPAELTKDFMTNSIDADRLDTSLSSIKYLQYIFNVLEGLEELSKDNLEELTKQYNEGQ
jgi:hypothetical protein